MNGQSLKKTGIAWNGVLLVLLSACSPWKDISVSRQDVEHFDYVGDTVDGWARVRKDSLWGFARVSGERVIPPQFDWVDDFREDRALVAKEGHYGFVDTRGKITRRLRYTEAYAFSEGLAPVQYKGRFGFIDSRGKWVVKPSYEWALPFRNRRAVVVHDGAYGTIDDQGHTVIAPHYDGMESFAGGVSIIRLEGKYGMVDTSGALVVEPAYKKIEPLEGDLYQLTDTSGRLGLVSPNGRPVLPVQYEYIGKPYQGKYRFVKKEGKFGLVDISGNVLIPAQYEVLGSLSQGRMAAMHEGKWGYINDRGKVMLPFEYDDYKNDNVNMTFHENRAWVKKDGRLLLIDTVGNVICKTDYDHGYRFSHSRAIVGVDSSRYESRFGFVDINGDEIIPLRYTIAMSFNENGIAWVGNRQQGLNYIRLIDTAGYALNDNVYFDLRYMGDSLIVRGHNDYTVFIDARTGSEFQPLYRSIDQVKDNEGNTYFKRYYADGKVDLVNTDYREILPPQYESIIAITEKRFAVKHDGKWGMVDFRNRPILPFVYDREMERFKKGVTKIVKDGKQGVIDTAGKEIIPCEYRTVTIYEGTNRITAEDSTFTDLYDLQGRPISMGEYEYIDGFSYMNRSAVRRNGKWGAVDYRMRIRCETIYDRIGKFESDSVAWVVLDGKIGYVDEHYNVIIPIVYDNGTVFANGMVRVEKDGETLYLDRAGNQIQPGVESIRRYEEKLEAIQRGYEVLNFSG